MCEIAVARCVELVGCSCRKFLDQSCTGSHGRVRLPQCVEEE